MTRSQYSISSYIVGLLMLALPVISGLDVPPGSIVGCYLDDSSDPDMGQPVNGPDNYDNMTRLSCACQCIEMGEPFAGVENGGYCYCNSSYGSYGESPCCIVPCTGDPSVTCGGSFALQVIDTSLVGSSTCGAETEPPTVAPTRITVQCPSSTVYEFTSTDHLKSFVVTETEDGITVTMDSVQNATQTEPTTNSLSDTSFQNDITTSWYSEASLITTASLVDEMSFITAWLTGQDPNTGTVLEMTADTGTVLEMTAGDIWSSESSVALILSTMSTIGSVAGSKSTTTTTVRPANALLDIDPCIANPPEVQESDRIGTYKESQGTAVGYTCHPGLVFDAGGVSRSAICLDGKWLYIAPSCQELECPPDCAIGGRALKLHQSVQLSCPPRQRFQCGMDTMTVTCFANGVAKMSPYSTCGDYCQPAPLLRNAVTVTNPEMREATVTCYSGYYFRDGTREKVFTCNADGIWQYEEHGCEQHKCPALAVPVNGSLSSEDVAYGTVVTASCFVGFMFPDGNLTKDFECVQMDDNSNQWNDTIEDCQAFRCYRSQTCSIVEVICTDWPPVLLNSAPSITSFSCPPYPYNSSFLYICLGGSRFEDGRTTALVTCTGNGYWQRDVSSCGTDRCPEVPQLKLATANSRLATNGSVVTYTCQEGYCFNGQSASAQTVCDGQRWSAVTSTCEAIQCPVLQVSHGQPASTARSVGSVVNVNCAVGYTTQSKLSFTCSPGGQWNQSGESCKLVDCMMPTGIQNAYLVPTASVISTTFGSNQSFHCMDGFWFSRKVRTANMTCAVDGKWRVMKRPDYGEKGCQPNSCLPLLFHVVNTTDQTPGTVANVSCEDGGQLLVSGLPFSLITMCGRLGTWEPRVPDCLGTRSYKHTPLKITEAHGASAIGTFTIFLVVTALFVPIAMDLLKCAPTKWANRIRK